MHQLCTMRSAPYWRQRGHQRRCVLCVILLCWLYASLIGLSCPLECLAFKAIYCGNQLWYNCQEYSCCCLYLILLAITKLTMGLQWPTHLVMCTVQNGLLYIRYRGSSSKNKADECKKLADSIPLGHTNLILCCSGQKTFQAGSVGRLDKNNNSHVISGFHLCVAEARTRVFNSLA